MFVLLCLIFLNFVISFILNFCVHIDKFLYLCVHIDKFLLVRVKMNILDEAQSVVLFPLMWFARADVVGSGQWPQLWRAESVILKIRFDNMILSLLFPTLTSSLSPSWELCLWKQKWILQVLWQREDKVAKNWQKSGEKSRNYMHQSC